MSEDSSKLKKRKKSKSSSVRRGYYRNVLLYSYYRKTNTLTFLLFIITILSAVCFFYFFFKDVPPRYIPLNDQNQVIEEQPLTSKSGFEDADVFSFALDAIRTMNVYDYINYKEQLQNGMEYFTDAGWNNYVQGFAGSATLNTVRKQHLVVTVQPTNAPEISREGVVSNAYKWQVKQPIEIRYYSQGSVQFSQSGVVTLLITRRPMISSEYGMGIEVYVLDVKK